MSQYFPPLKFNLSEFLKIHKQRDALEAIMWTLMSIPVVMLSLNGNWLNDLSLDSPETLLKLVSRITGLYAAQLILLQLIVISRNPFLNYLYGHDKLTAFHKKLGKPAYILLVIHFIAVIQEYVIKENQTFLYEFLALFKYPDLANAVIGFMFLTVVVFTSLNWIRKNIPYELWYATHLLTYIAVIVSFPHQVSMGTDIKSHWITLGYWWGLYITTLAFIILFRFGRPLYITLRHQLVVDKVVQETNNVVSIYIKGRKLDKLDQNAGQFYMWKFLTWRTFFQTNPFSISTSPNNDYMRVTISNLGGGTKAIHKYVKKGTRVMVDGPYGIFTGNRRLFKHVTLIAAGVGITPIRSLVEDLPAEKGDITVIYRGDKEESMPFIEELREFERTKGINLHLSIGKRAFYNSWLSASSSPEDNAADILKIAPNVTVSDVYICGPVGWTKSVKNTLLKIGVAKEQIHIEEFAW